jgi:uncharacterized cupin superfamily protein
VPLRGLDQLGEHPAGRFRVQERHAAASDADAGLLVDQAKARGSHGLEARLDVVRPVRHMVKAGSAPREELPDSRVRAERPQQLHVGVAHAEQHGLDALLLHGLAVLERHAEPLAVERDGLVKVLDGHSYVINASEHGVSRIRGMVNIERPDFDQPREQEGFRALRAGISRQAGAVRLGVSLWELPPGEAAYPYHAHLTEEELVIVLAGTPSLRTPDGWRELEQGEVVSFPRGEEGAHQIVNRTDESVRFLAFSPSGEPDVVLQLDSGKIGAFERRPDGGGLRLWFRREDEVGYYEGESPPG